MGETRSLQRTAVDILRGDLEARFEVVEGGPWDGVSVITRKQVDEAFALFEPIPPSQHVAEVVTPSTILVDALCPSCGLPVSASIQLHSRLTVESGHRQVTVKGKTTPVGHVCGQTVLPVGPDEVGTEPAFDIEDITGGVQEDTEADADEAPAPDTSDEPCPHPGCIRGADHGGQHRKS